MSSAPPEPLPAVVLCRVEAAGKHVHAAVPETLVYHESDGRVAVYGRHAEKARAMIGRSAEAGPVLTVTVAEWETVFNRLDFEDVYVVA